MNSNLINIMSGHSAFYGSNYVLQLAELECGTVMFIQTFDFIVKTMCNILDYRSNVKNLLQQYYPVNIY